MSINLNKVEELFRYRKSGKMKIWRKKIWQLFFRFNPGDGFIMGRVNRNEGRATFVRKKLKCKNAKCKNLLPLLLLLNTANKVFGEISNTLVRNASYVG